MVRVLTELTRAMIIGRLQTGQKQSDVAIFFGVSQAAVSKIKQKFVEANDVKKPTTFRTSSSNYSPRR